VGLPLFFLPRGHQQLARSAYDAIRHKGRAYPAGRVDAGAVAWATTQITAFVHQEQNWATSLAVDYENDPLMQMQFHEEPNLVRRIKGIDPLPVL